MVRHSVAQLEPRFDSTRSLNGLRIHLTKFSVTFDSLADREAGNRKNGCLINEMDYVEKERICIAFRVMFY